MSTLSDMRPSSLSLSSFVQQANKKAPLCRSQCLPLYQLVCFFGIGYLWCLRPCQQHVQFLHIEQLNRLLYLEDCMSLLFNILKLNSKFLLLILLSPFLVMHQQLFCTEQVTTGCVSPVCHMKATTRTFYLHQRELVRICVWLCHSLLLFLYVECCLKMLGIIASLSETMNSIIVHCLSFLIAVSNTLHDS